MNNSGSFNNNTDISKKKALITGVAGQDGSYLAEFLSEKGYDIFGVDKSFSKLPKKIKNCIFKNYRIDLTRRGLLKKLIQEIMPDEIYHLAAYHFSSQKDGNSKMEFETFCAINLLATNEILETIKNNVPDAKFFYASSSHIFGKADHSPQDENTPYRPETLYAITKAAGNELCRFYREYHGVYASIGILYNHESPRRSLSFITTQIAEAAARSSLGMPVKLSIRDLDGIVDWGAARDYVNAMWLSLQQLRSDNYIISSGVSYRVRDFIQIAFDYVGQNATNFVFQNTVTEKNFKMPYIGDSTKIRKICGWEPVISLKQVVEEMVDVQIKRLK